MKRGTIERRGGGGPLATIFAPFYPSDIAVFIRYKLAAVRERRYICKERETRTLFHFASYDDRGE